ncbi:hypothetical protein J3F84DRAFT_379614 [Trichoderma pleuroticola]
MLLSSRRMSTKHLETRHDCTCVRRRCFLKSPRRWSLAVKAPTGIDRAGLWRRCTPHRYRTACPREDRDPGCFVSSEPATLHGHHASLSASPSGCSRVHLMPVLPVHCVPAVKGVEQYSPPVAERILSGDTSHQVGIDDAGDDWGKGLANC